MDSRIRFARMSSSFSISMLGNLSSTRCISGLWIISLSLGLGPGFGKVVRIFGSSMLGRTVSDIDIVAVRMNAIQKEMQLNSNQWEYVEFSQEY